MLGMISYSKEISRKIEAYVMTEAMYLGYAPHEIKVLIEFDENLDQIYHLLDTYNETKKIFPLSDISPNYTKQIQNKLDIFIRREAPFVGLRETQLKIMIEFNESLEQSYTLVDNKFEKLKSFELDDLI